MSRFTCILLSVLVGFAALCAEANTTIVVKQITDPNQLPEKTVQLKLQRYELADGALAAEVKGLLGDVCRQDAGHTAFTLKIQAGSDGGARVEIAGLDELQATAAGKAAWGILPVESRCFVLLGKPLGKLFAKAKGKHTLVQEYEVVDEATPRAGTMVSATWSGSRLQPTRYLIDGGDLLLQQPAGQSNGSGL